MEEKDKRKFKNRPSKIVGFLNIYHHGRTKSGVLRKEENVQLFKPLCVPNLTDDSSSFLPLPTPQNCPPVLPTLHPSTCAGVHRDLQASWQVRMCPPGWKDTENHEGKCDAAITLGMNPADFTVSSLGPRGVQATSFRSQALISPHNTPWDT